MWMRNHYGSEQCNAGLHEKKTTVFESTKPLQRGMKAWKDAVDGYKIHSFYFVLEDGEDIHFPYTYDVDEYYRMLDSKVDHILSQSKK